MKFIKVIKKYQYAYNFKLYASPKNIFEKFILRMKGWKNAGDFQEYGLNQEIASGYYTHLKYCVLSENELKKRKLDIGIIDILID